MALHPVLEAAESVRHFAGRFRGTFEDYPSVGMLRMLKRGELLLGTGRFSLAKRAKGSICTAACA